MTQNCETDMQTLFFLSFYTIISEHVFVCVLINGNSDFKTTSSPLPFPVPPFLPFINRDWKAAALPHKRLSLSLGHTWSPFVSNIKIGRLHKRPQQAKKVRLSFGSSSRRDYLSWNSWPPRSLKKMCRILAAFLLRNDEEVEDASGVSLKCILSCWT